MYVYILLKHLGYWVHYPYVYIIPLYSLSLVIYLECHNYKISTIMREETNQDIHIHILYIHPYSIHLCI